MHDQGTITRALAVLEEAVNTKRATQTKGIALALWVLRGRCEDDWLRWFWQSCEPGNDIGQSQNISAAYNGIVRQVRERR
jgi:hypothetical protein